MSSYMNTVISYLTSEQIIAKEKEFGSVWMAFFRFEEGKYICDGIKVDGKWKGKNSVFTSWKTADAYLRANGYEVRYAESPLDGKVIAVNMGVIGVYLRTEHPTYADRLAKQVHLPSIRFAKFNADGTGFIGYNPDMPKIEKLTFKIDPSLGASLIGESGCNTKDFVRKTGARFSVKMDKVILEASSEKMEFAETELKSRLASLVPSLGSESAKPRFTKTSYADMVTKGTFEDFILPPTVETGKLIGPKGIHIQALREHTECKMEVLEDSVSGNSMLRVHHISSETRKSAYHTVLAFLEYLSDTEKFSCPIPIYSDAVTVPGEIVGHLIGIKGNNLRLLRQQSNCDFFYDKETSQFRVSSYLKTTLNQGVTQLQNQMKKISTFLASTVPSVV